MATIRIFDIGRNTDVSDLHDDRRLYGVETELFLLLVSGFGQTQWMLGPVREDGWPDQEFDAYGPSSGELEELAYIGEFISFEHLMALLKNVSQIIWGEFRGFKADITSEPWVTIRSVDSTYYEVVSDDAGVIEAIKTNYFLTKMMDG